MTDRRTITEIPLDELHDSPFNPPDRASLRIDEMAAAIRSAGGMILQPLLTRPRTAGGFEVVYGHRRKYGALAEGLATAPCEVRALTDAEARTLQALENVQRENLKALEEAQAYQAMIDGDNLTADDVAKAIGKSRSHVYGRLRLLSLCPQVRQALQSGEVQGEVALLIARVGDEKMQGKALRFIRNIGAELGDGGTKSYRRIRELLNEKFTLDLGKAIFPIEAEMLVPSAGNCITCRKRTGNAPEFADVASVKPAETLDAEEEAFEAKFNAAADDEADAMYAEHRAAMGRVIRLPHAGANVCTDPDCFEAKKKAHLKAEAARMEAAGATVIAGGKARQAVNAQGQLADGFIAADKVDLAKAKGDVKLVVIQDPRAGRTFEAYRAEDLAAAGVKVKASKAKAASGGHDPHAWERERERKLEEAQRETTARLAILAAVRTKAATAPRGALDLRLVARAMVAQLPYSGRDVLLGLYQAETPNDLLQTIDGMTMDTLGCLLLDCALVENVEVEWHNLSRENQPAALLAAAGHYGIDTDAVRQSVAAPVQTPATEPASTPAAKGKKAKAAKAEPQRELI